MRQQKRRRLCCPNGHVLTKMIASERLRKFNSFVPQLNCDRCRCYVRGDDMTGCCEMCDFDLCFSCCENPSSRDSDDDLRRRKTCINYYPHHQGAVVVTETTTTSRSMDRYNGLRICRKISSPKYPDPTLYGWTFTGSSEQQQMEYFEKCFQSGTVLLDVNVLYGRVHTILDRPQQQPEILFSKNSTPIQPQLYLCILQNPLHHKSFSKDVTSTTSYSLFSNKLQNSNSTMSVF